MVVDYVHRLLITGSQAAVRAFRHDMHREYERTVGGQTWTEIVPFSFAALYGLAPNASRIEKEIPFDPYELSAWPVRRVNARISQVRYQFQTRNLEMVGLLRTLSRALPSITFTLTTLCLDDSSIETHHISRGTGRRWVIPQRCQQFHWDRARGKFGLPGDEVFDDDEAERWVEEEMLNEASAHWEDGSGNPARRRYRWWNQPVLRDLTTERRLAMYEIAEGLSPKARPRKPKALVRSAARKGRRSGR